MLSAKTKAGSSEQDPALPRLLLVHEGATPDQPDPLQIRGQHQITLQPCDGLKFGIQQLLDRS